MPIRFTIWAVVSTLLAIAVVQHAVATRESFFPAAVYLSTSKFALAVLVQFCVVLLVSFGRLVKWTFLGPLAPREVEVRVPRAGAARVRAQHLSPSPPPHMLSPAAPPRSA